MGKDSAFWVISRFSVYNNGKLSLTHTQLKVGTANQRHLFSPAAILLSTIQKRK